MGAEIPFFTVNEAKTLLPASSAKDNKSLRGKSLLIAGSAQYPGAGVLCARAALRAGSGYVYLAQNPKPSLLESTPEVIPVTLNSNLEFDPNVAIAIGSGAGVGDATAESLQRLSQINHAKVVVDADALTVLAQIPNLHIHPEWILTPHEGELARLLQVDSQDISSDRPQWIRLAQEKFGCVVVLKGDRTLVADAKSLTQNSSGNAGLAKAGTGDVLTGIITAFRAQGLSAVQAARLGVFVHGMCADVWVREGKDFLSLTASDVIDLLPEVIYGIRNFTASP